MRTIVDAWVTLFLTLLHGGRNGTSMWHALDYPCNIEQDSIQGINSLVDTQILDDEEIEVRVRHRADDIFFRC